MLLMKDLLCSVLLSAWLLVLFLLVLVYVAGSWSKSLRRIFWMICFCDNRVMAKRTTLLTVVFRVIMKSILRPSEGRLLRCFTHAWIMYGFPVWPSWDTQWFCHASLYDSHHVLAKVFCLLVLFPSALLLSCISWCILIALRSVWFRFVVVMVSASHAAACACCLAVCFLCSRRLDSDLLARVLSAWFSFSFHLICDAYAMQSLAW